jgi:hypothetical protein
LSNNGLFQLSEVMLHYYKQTNGLGMDALKSTVIAEHKKTLAFGELQIIDDILAAYDRKNKYRTTPK